MCIVDSYNWRHRYISWFMWATKVVLNNSLGLKYFLILHFWLDFVVYFPWTLLWRSKQGRRSFSCNCLVSLIYAASYAIPTFPLAFNSKLGVYLCYGATLGYARNGVTGKPNCLLALITFLIDGFSHFSPCTQQQVGVFFYYGAALGCVDQAKWRSWDGWQAWVVTMMMMMSANHQGYWPAVCSLLLLAKHLSSYNLHPLLTTPIEEGNEILRY